MTTHNQATGSTNTWLERRLPNPIANWDIEKLLYALILILAIISRFTILGERVMSHDEVNHVRPSWELYTGQGYRHDPVTHGPFQFHAVALSYTLFGDTDFTSRLPAALFSIATVMMAWKFRRYFGKAGALLAAVFFLVSPYMLFYGRYTRNEAFVAFWGVATIYLVLRYLQEGREKHLLMLAGIWALQFTTKETSYIYAAQLLLFLLIVFLKNIFSAEWKDQVARFYFITGLLISFALIAAGIILHMVGKSQAAALDPALAETIVIPFVYSKLPLILFATAILDLAYTVVQLIRGLGIEKVREDRSFDLLILVGTMVLPQLAAFPIKLFGFDPLDYSGAGITRTGIALGLLFLISGLIGVWWKGGLWIKAAAIFYGIYVFFYTTIFTNGQGFFTGIVGSLGYWISQQDVQRGSQPLYYYGLVQIPMYEFLPAIGSLLGMFYAIRLLMRRKAAQLTEIDPGDHEVEDREISTGLEPAKRKVSPLFQYLFLTYWVITALGAYSYAGERMPWLTVHITLPMILLAGAAFGQFIEKMDWQKVKAGRGVLSISLLVLFVVALAGIIKSLFSPIPPFSGNTLEQISATTGFTGAVLFLLATAAGLVYLVRQNREVQYGRLLGIILLVGLVGLTARSAYLASFVNYDTAKEYLVYAHAARGPKEILEQVEEISERIAGGKTLRVAYDNSSLYPYWWYFRDFPNLDYFGEQPSKSLKDDAIVIVGNPNYSKVDPILQKDFYNYEYPRLWWPNQDYYNLTWERVWNAIRDPKIRAGIFDIWLNRDYAQYAQATGSRSLTLETWDPAEKIRLYIRKDIASRIWDLGLAPAAVVEEKDPYESAKVAVIPDQVIGGPGKEPGQFDAPRAIALAGDGSLYIADSRNHRIQHLAQDGTVIETWGSFADVAQGDAPGGTFYEPWGVAVSPDGSVFVTDTWNHRVQKFDAQGKFLLQWGYFGQAEKPDAFWGPRGIYVDQGGNVFVADTGNKRIVVFDEYGGYITQFGSYGLEAGQFDEPVGVWGDAQGLVYVADTWNQRVQVFDADESGTIYQVVNSWDVNAWKGQSLENKPFITVGPQGSIYIVDPEGYRVLVFNPDGTILKTWGEYSPDADGFGLASGIAVDADNGVWVSDGANMRLLHFSLP